jgi:lipid-binding SYLF domain-containing protein
MHTPGEVIADGATPAEAGIRRQIASEREELARTLGELRAEVDVTRKLPLVLATALGAGFVLGGGIGATMRLLMRRTREGTEKARVGRFSLAKRH